MIGVVSLCLPGDQVHVKSVGERHVLDVAGGDDMVPVTNERLSCNEFILHVNEFLEWVPVEFNVKCGVVHEYNLHKSNSEFAHLFLLCLYVDPIISTRFLTMQTGGESWG